MNLIKRIFIRLNAEYVWMKLGLYTRFAYYKRKPLLEFDPPIRGGKLVTSVIWQ